MIIPIASDHAGFDTKERAIQILRALGHEPLDLGTHSSDSVDYPDYAALVSKKVSEGDFDFGILVCGSGQGMCMTANKFQNVRAALVYSPKVASLTRQHNNANIMCLPGRELSEEELSEILKSWFNSSFEGGRHEKRVSKIHLLTNR